MSNGNGDGQPKGSTKIEFIQFHQPPLKDGHYSLQVEQSILVGGTVVKTYPSEQAFVITGDRYRINPQDILSVFPPPDSRGDHANVLAHVVLRRSTLPWEREAEDGNKDWPWLAVLLFDEDEAPLPKVIDLKTLFADQRAASFPDLKQLPRDPGEHDEDRVTVIDVPAELLREIAPSGEELALLSHVRQWESNTEQNIGGERAVVLGNRLPRRGRTSVVHLVSVEGRYQNGQFYIPDERPVRLVSLKSWRFACLDETIGGRKLSFTHLLESLDVGPLCLPEGALRTAAGEAEADAARIFQSRGFFPAPHHLRNGQDSVSWYHGPLIPFKNSHKSSMKLPAKAADGLLGLDPRYGLYDVSYAAAWEMGRLLALQDGDFALALYHWKRAHARQQKDVAGQFPHLPFNQEDTVPDIPDTVSTWLYDLALLKGLPFNYLVPDERMLPQESLRFFYLDQDWIACLLDGAFSIGRVLSGDHERERAIYDQARSLRELTRNPSTGESIRKFVTGFLLRSDVVAGWPHFQVDAYPFKDETVNIEPAGFAMDLLRMDHLSPNVLLCLFSGQSVDEQDILTLDIHQKPEGLHSGVTAGDGVDSWYQKAVRGADGKELENQSVRVWFRGQHPRDSRPPESRVLSIASLAADLQRESTKGATQDIQPNAATFALQMIEGVERVRFVIKHQ